MWTKEQEAAIVKTGCNIIVSAGAGSGKTAVLSERILEKCKKGTDIRRVLVLTFTKAAAEEMKERIRKKLIDNDLIEQSNYIDSAYITTFDSYSLSLVKKYYYRLGIKKDVSIMDNAMVEMKKNEIIDDLFKRYYTIKEPKFYSFLERLCKQDDKELKTIIKGFCSKLELLIDYNKFVDEYEKNYLSNEKIYSLADEYEKIIGEEVSRLKELLDRLLVAISNDTEGTKLYDSIDDFFNKLNSSSTYEEYYQLINNYTFPRLNSKASDSVKELKTEASNMVKGLISNYLSKYSSKEEMINELYKFSDDVLLILNIAKEANNLLFDYKKEVGMFDYSDIARLAIKLVTDFDDIRNELVASYDEILVDEYQDTSDIQEFFLSRIENNNRYMVGDIKQSIYRFRNANPYIFKEKYENYSRNIGGYKIDLSYNFRSRKEVLDNINSLFNILMTNECGDADYINSHQMIYGQKMYDNGNYLDYKMDVLTYDETEYYNNEEVEAFIIANSIKQIIESKTLVLKGKEYIPVKYSDFAILIDKAKHFTTFKRILEYLHIPASIEASLDMKDSIIPKLFSNIIVLINGYKNNNFNVKFNHARASLARSFIYEYDDDTIYRMINFKFENKLDDDIKYLASLEVCYSQLFYEICNRLDIYNKLSLIGNVDESIVILEAVHNFMKGFTNLMDFNEVEKYLNSLFDSDISLPYTLVSSSSDSVRIMTIHKSKGLEFAFCYFPMLFSSFNRADEKAAFGLDLQYGAYIPYVEDGKSNTILKTLCAEKINKADISEKVRLFYVALTRAREKIFLVLPDKEKKNSITSFLDMLNQCNLEDYKKKINLDELNISRDYKKIFNKEAKSNGKNIIYPELGNIKIKDSTRISKVLKGLPDLKTKQSIDLGLKFHEILQIIDLKNPNLEEVNIDNNMKRILKDILGLEIFKNISFADIYHEHEFICILDNNEYHGIIDLFLEYDDHIDLIDYKLFDVSKAEYIKQLSIYKRYLESVSSKKVDAYLLSILSAKIKKVEL
ncbi:MAG: UvrD-helicase domain-containing protein [Anaeroplasma sp.]